MAREAAHTYAAVCGTYLQHLVPMKVTRATLHALTPVNLVRPAEEAPELFEAVVARYHNVLPNVGRRFMRKYLAHTHIHTLALLLPEALDDNDDEGDDEDDDDEDDEESSSDEETDPSPSLAPATAPPEVMETAQPTRETTDELVASPPSPARGHVDESFEADAAEGDGEEAAEGSEGQKARPPLTAEARALRRRLVGCVSYEYGNRLGQRLVQVSLLGVRLKYQRFGIGAKLVRALLEGEATPERPEAAIAWADHKAVAFFRRFGFNDDKILNSRYREISEPWDRSVLMSAQLPPPLPQLSAVGADRRWADEATFEEQLDAWRQSRLLEYSRELALVERLQARPPAAHPQPTRSPP